MGQHNLKNYSKGFKFIGKKSLSQKSFDYFHLVGKIWEDLDILFSES